MATTPAGRIDLMLLGKCPGSTSAYTSYCAVCGPRRPLVSKQTPNSSMPLPPLPYKRPFFSMTLTPHEIEVRDGQSAHSLLGWGVHLIERHNSSWARLGMTMFVSASAGGPCIDNHEYKAQEASITSTSREKQRTVWPGVTARA